MIFFVIFICFIFSYFIWQHVERIRREPANFPKGILDLCNNTKYLLDHRILDGFNEYRTFKRNFFKFKGPRSILPLIGMVSAGRAPQKHFLKLSKKWGNIYAYDMGNRRAIVVNHYKDLRELLPRIEFNGRPNHRSIMLFCSEEKYHGILFNNEREPWAEQRRFTLRNLRDFGFGTRSMESHLEREIRELIDNFKSYQGKPVLIDHHFNGPVLNSILAILLGNRFEQNDPIINDLYRRLTEDFFLLPFLTYFPFFFTLHKWIPSLMGFVEKYIQNRHFTFKYMRELVDNHKRSHAKGAERDFIDKYLSEIEEDKNPNSSFYGKTGENNLVTIIHDLFLAGSETTSTVLGWTVHLFALYPEIQEKAFQEIKSVVGLSRYAKLDERNMLPFTNATIFEILRFASIVPIIVHEVDEDAIHNDIFFPKGTSIIYNNHAALHDPEYWGDPEVFRPQRFLAEDGITLIKHDAFIPFHFGKRRCIGESLAKDSLFLFTTAILQRFRIYPEPSKPIPREIKCRLAATNMAVSFPIIFEDRFEK